MSFWTLVFAGVLAFAGMRFPQWRAVIAVLLLALLVSAAGIELRQDSYSNAEVDRLIASRASVTATATVIGDPRKTRERVVGQQRQEPRVLLLVRAEVLEGSGQRLHVRFPMVGFFDDLEPTTPGDCLVIQGRVGAFHDGRPLISQATVTQRCGSASRLQHIAARVRAGLQKAAVRLPPDARGLLPGLVVGDTSQLSPTLEADMRTVNLTHLTAVSGANLAIVAAFVLLVARALGVRRRVIPVVTVIAIAFFVVIARPEPSVLRAGVMAMVLIVASVLGSRHAAFSALAFAVSVLLLVNPEQARNLGFALSVSATAGLILWASRLTQTFARRLPKVLAVGLAVPVAAQLACTPLLVAISGQLSLIGVITNFLAAPLVAPATVLGLMAALVALIFEEASTWIGFIAGLPVMAIAAIARISADLPFASLPMPQGLGGAAAALVIIGAIGLGLRWKKRATVFSAVSMIVAVCVLALLQPGWPMRDWQFVACDVGQGDALVVRLDHRSAMLVDAGPTGKPVVECLRRLGVERISLLVITHAHADHFEGLPAVLDHFVVDEVLLPAAADEDEQDRRLALMVSEIDHRRVNPGERLRWGKVQVEVLWPRYLISEGSMANNNSTVMLVRTAQATLLLLADVEKAAQEALPPLREVDLVKIAHHGSGDFSPKLMRNLSPDLAVISVGADNPYGHPHRSLLRSLGKVPVLRTDLQGSVAVAWREGGAAVRARGHPWWLARR